MSPKTLVLSRLEIALCDIVSTVDAPVVPNTLGMCGAPVICDQGCVWVDGVKEEGLPLTPAQVAGYEVGLLVILAHVWLCVSGGKVLGFAATSDHVVG